jgi:hypothetical protein
MTNREQLLQELAQAPDELVQTMLDFLHCLRSELCHNYRRLTFGGFCQNR